MEAVIEAPVTEDQPIQSSAEETGQSAPVVASEPAITPQDVPADDVKGDERTLPQWVKNLKAMDPKAYRQAANDFFGRRDLQAKLKDFDIDKTRAWLDENGGVEGIEMSRTEAQTKAQELDALNEAFAQGDTGFIEKIAQSEGFAKIAYAAIDKAAQVDPDGWNAKMSGVFDATIAQSPIPQRLERMDWNISLLSDMLAQVPEVANNPVAVRAFQEMAEQFGEVKKWTQSFKGTQQQSVPGQRQQPNAAEQTAQQKLADIEQATFTKEYRTEAETWREGEVKKELASYFDRKKDDKDAQDIAVSTVISRVKQRMSQDADYQGKLRALEARKDKPGALRLMQSRERAAIQEIAPAIGRSVFGNPKPKEELKQPTAAARPAANKRPTNAFDEIWQRA